MSKLNKLYYENKPYTEMDDIRSDLNSLRSNIVRLSGHMYDDASGRTRKASRRAMKKASRFGDDQVKNARLLGRDMERGFRSHPFETLAVAFVTGLVASFIFGRR